MADKLSRSYIGLHVAVKASSDKDLVGCEGVVIDETKYSFIIEDAAGSHKRVLKRKTTFLFEEDVVKGDDILKRPEERIKSRGK